MLIERRNRSCRSGIWPARPPLYGFKMEPVILWVGWGAGAPCFLPRTAPWLGPRLTHTYTHNPLLPQTTCICRSIDHHQLQQRFILELESEHNWRAGLETLMDQIWPVGLSLPTSELMLGMPLRCICLCFRIPHELFKQLQILLAAHSISGRDWRKLAPRPGTHAMKVR